MHGDQPHVRSRRFERGLVPRTHGDRPRKGPVVQVIKPDSPARTGICRAERPTRRRIYPTPRAHGAQAGMTGALRRPARTGIDLGLIPMWPTR